MLVRGRSQAHAVDRAPPVVLVLAACLSVQFGAALAATLFADIGPEGASMVRVVFAAVILAVASRPAVRGRPAADLRLVFAMGCSLGLMNFSFYEALDRLPLGVTVTIEFIGPVTVAVVLSRRRADLVWAALAAGGIVVLTRPFGGGGIDRVGLLFALLAAACWGSYIPLAHRAAGRYEGAEGLALASIVAALIPLGPGIAVAGDALLDARLLALGACVAFLSSVVPHTLGTVALRRMPARVFGVLMSLEPVVATMAGLIVLGQRLHAVDAVGMALVGVASIGVTRSARESVLVDS
jgi:inner membrane transporter RhtA